MKTTIQIEIEHAKPIPDLAQLVAQRAWSIDGVTSTSDGKVVDVVALPVKEMAEVQHHGI